MFREWLHGFWFSYKPKTFNDDFWLGIEYVPINDNKIHFVAIKTDPCIIPNIGYNSKYCILLR